MTNFESMTTPTINGLAKLIALIVVLTGEIHKDGECGMCCAYDPYKCDGDCENGIKKWLEQEVEKND